MEANVKVPVSPDEVVAAIAKSIEQSSILSMMIPQALAEDLMVKVLRNLFNVEYGKDET